MKKGGAVYIMTNQWNSTLYTGVTSDLVKRMYQHKNKMYKDSFTSKYNLNKLVYFEVFHSMFLSLFNFFLLLIIQHTAPICHLVDDPGLPF